MVAVELPSEDTTAGFDTYAEVVRTALDGCDHNVILVGHSLGANTIPLVATRRPVSHLVYLCGVVPAIGRSVFDQIAGSDMMVPGWDAGLGEPDAASRTKWADLERTRAVLFGDCAESLADAALARLRPQAHYPSTVPFPLTEYPAVDCTSVICSDDRMVNPSWSKRIARDRLGAAVVDLPGSHSPFLSRPSAVADVLLRVAAA